MSTILWSVLFGLLGFLAGAGLGFAAALAWASALPAPNDGTFAMREMLVCVPVGALVGAVAGIAWAMR